MSQPFQRLRFGRIQVAIWKNEDEQHRPRFNATFSRSFKDEAGKWHNTDSFGRDELLLLAKAANEAHTFILNQQATQPPEPTSTVEPTPQRARAKQR